MIPQFAVHGLMTSKVHGRSEEISAECEDMDEVLTRIKELTDMRQDWQVITVLHIEDFPAIMEGAVLLT